MKKSLLFILAVLLLCAKGESQQLLRFNTATTVNIGPFEDSAGAVQTGLTVTSITVKLIKQSDTFSSSVTSFSPTASGGSNDCQHVASGMYNLELTASNLDTLGRIDLVATISGALPVFHRFEVVPQATYDTLVTNGPASGADLLNTLTSTLTTVGGFGKLVSDNLDSPSSGIKADTSGIVTTLGTPAGADVSTDIAAVKTDTAAVKVKTDFLPSATAGAAGGVFIAGSNAATTANITGNLTGNVSGSVGSVTGAVGSVTGNIGGNVTGNVTGSVGSLGTQAKLDAVFHLGVETGTAQGSGGGNNTIQLASGASATNNRYSWRIITLTGGTGAGQIAQIQSYVGATKTATIFCQNTTTGNWQTNPDATTTYSIVPAKR